MRKRVWPRSPGPCVSVSSTAEEIACITRNSFGERPADVVARQQVEQAMGEGVAAARPVGVPCLDLVDDRAEQDGDVADGFGIGLGVRVDRVAVMRARR